MQRLNKQVLNGFLQQAISHNKYLEEREMWKKKNEESPSKKRKKRHKSGQKISKEKSPSPSDDEMKETKPKSSRTPEELDDLKAILALYKSAKEDNNEKWGHSGFQELYPDFKPESNEKKASIDNRLEIINEKATEAKKDRTKKSKKKKKKSEKYKNNDDLSSRDSSSDSSLTESEDSKKRHHKKKSKKRKK